MADVKISALPVATAVSATDVGPIVHTGTTVKATASQITTAALNATPVTVAQGGSSATTFTAGYLKANGVNPFTTVAAIPYSDVTGGPPSNLGHYGAFQDLGADQTAASNTVTLLRIDTTDFTQGVTRTGSRITLTNAGVYSIIISLQLSNTSANYDNFTLWPVINGTAPTASASLINVPEKKGNINGLAILTVQYTYQFSAGGYFEFNWHNVSGNAKVVTYPASLTTPIHPAAAGVILSVIQVA